jgi:hypothetical protein
MAALEVNMLSSRISMALLAGAFGGALAVGSASLVQALPLPVSTAALAGDKSVDQVAYHGGFDRGRGVGHRSGGSTADTARSSSGCDPHPNPDKMDYCGYHFGQ